MGGGKWLYARPTDAPRQKVVHAYTKCAHIPRQGSPVQAASFVTLNVRTYQDKVLLCELLHLFLLRSQGDVKVIDSLRQFNIVLL